MVDSYDAAQLLSDLTLDEGREAFPYKDTRGLITIGIGRNLSSNGLSAAEIDLLYKNDVTAVVIGLDSRLPWWRTLPPGEQGIIINLGFNLGITKLLTFGTFLGLMRAGRFVAAAADLATTAWYKQVGLRGPRIQKRIIDRAEPPTA